MNIFVLIFILFNKVRNKFGISEPLYVPVVTMLEPIKQLAETKLKNDEAKTEILAMVLGRDITHDFYKYVHNFCFFKSEIVSNVMHLQLRFLLISTQVFIPSYISGCRRIGNHGIAGYCCVIGVILLQTQTIRNKNKKRSCMT